MTPTKKCPYCDTTLEFELSDGKLMRFKAHDDTFCRDATRGRVRDLERALVAQRENFEYAASSWHRAFEERVFELASELEDGLGYNDSQYSEDVALLLGPDGVARWREWKHR